MAVGKSGAKASSPTRKTAEEQLPGPEEARMAFAPALSPSLDRVRTMLASMAASPPQLLHMEGGVTEQRVALALWWAALLNCEAGDPPCLSCPSCFRTGTVMHPDVVFLDGRAASIKIADVRGLRALLGEKPHFGRYRIVVLAEAQALGTEAANSLLKVLEEPCPDTCFVFTAPQRERLLPTLVSRGWVLTLPWPAPGRSVPEEYQKWERALARFVSEGRGWFDLSAERGVMDAVRAQYIVLLGQKALADRMAGREGSILSDALAGVPEERFMDMNDLFVNCQESLQSQVNPLLVLDSMATRMYQLTHGNIQGNTR